MCDFAILCLVSCVVEKYSGCVCVRLCLCVFIVCLKVRVCVYVSTTTATMTITTTTTTLFEAYLRPSDLAAVGEFLSLADRNPAGRGERRDGGSMRSSS